MKSRILSCLSGVAELGPDGDVAVAELAAPPDLPQRVARLRQRGLEADLGGLAHGVAPQVRHDLWNGGCFQ